MRTLTQEQFIEEATKRFGEDTKQWKFVCPMCGTVQSVQQLIDALVASGRPKEDVHKYVGFSCIGRFTGRGGEGIAARTRGEKWDKGCDWTLGGLLRVHTLEVIIDGQPRPTFELAEGK